MAGQYQIPEWLIPKETPGQALSRGIQDGATVARGMADNYFRNKDQQRQDALMPLHIQQMQMAVKNQALDLEIAQARQQTMLAQKSAYADLATFNAQVASTPNGYLDQNNFQKFWQLGQQHPELISDPVFTQTMGQFDKAKKMKEVEDQAKALQDYRNNLIAARLKMAAGHDAAKATKANIYSQDLVQQSLNLRADKRSIEKAKATAIADARKFGKNDGEIAKIARRFDEQISGLEIKRQGIDSEWQRRLNFHGLDSKDETFDPDTQDAAQPPGTPGPGWGAHRQGEDSPPEPDASDPWSRFQQSKGASPASEYINTDDPAAPSRLTTDQIPAWMDQQAQGYDQAPND